MDTELINNNVYKPLDLSGFKVLGTVAEELTATEYITNPAIARESEIKKLIIILLTPEKSALLIGKAGIGKTAIVEGLAYLIKRNDVPEALKGYHILKVSSSALTGNMMIDDKEIKIINKLVDELKDLSKTILFIDEIHTLMGSKESGPMDLANILKPALDRGDVKAIGATTDIEYNQYIVRDRAFLRRFDRVDVAEPDGKTTVKILMGSLPKIEAKTGIKFKYSNYVTSLLVEAIVNATSEFKRVYGLSAMYPDVSFSVLTQAFSNALFNNKGMVDIEDVYMAIKTSKRIYPDSIVKELKAFKEKFKQICEEEGVILPDVSINDLEQVENDF